VKSGQKTLRSEKAKKTVGRLKGRCVIVAVTGGIAAYKSATLVSRLVQECADVTVMMTESATRFVTPLTFQSLSGRRTYVSLWESTEDYSILHISPTEKADLIVVAPATADILAKAAVGIADDLVSTALLSAKCPILFAPAMHASMWEHPATKLNVKTLRERDCFFSGPEKGRFASGGQGIGRMAEPETILEDVAKLLDS
jgi:phosphopantothenoylcysteine decarboxylase/phosphopantothenate--cysteine ligase